MLPFPLDITWLESPLHIFPESLKNIIQKWLNLLHNHNEVYLSIPPDPPFITLTAGVSRILLRTPLFMSEICWRSGVPIEGEQSLSCAKGNSANKPEGAKQEGPGVDNYPSLF